MSRGTLMQGRPLLSRSPSFRPENLGLSSETSAFVIGVLAFTIIAATYQPEDPLLHPSMKLTSFLISTSNPTFRSDESTAHTSDDFLTPNFTSDASSTITLSNTVLFVDDNSTSTAADANEADESVTVEGCKDGPIACRDTKIFQTVMRATIEMFYDIHFYRFGKLRK